MHPNGTKYSILAWGRPVTVCGDSHPRAARGRKRSTWHAYCCDSSQNESSNPAACRSALLDSLNVRMLRSAPLFIHCRLAPTAVCTALNSLRTSCQAEHLIPNRGSESVVISKLTPSGLNLEASANTFRSSEYTSDFCFRPWHHL